MGAENQEETEDLGLRTRVKLVVLVLAVIAGSVLIFAPVVPVQTLCYPIPCIPAQMKSVSLYYLGFGVESSYNGTYYYFCTFQRCSSI